MRRVGQQQQVGVSRQQRQQQLALAFRVCSPTLVRGAHTILVDDVLTTSATLEAAGARRIEMVVFIQA